MRRALTGHASGDILEKLGLKAPNLTKHQGKRIWIHAVSYGEIKTIERFIEDLLSESPDIYIYLSTTTDTGYALATELYANSGRVQHFYMPFDLWWTVERYLRYIEPDMLIITETELWPELLYQARNLETYIINGRLSQGSYTIHRLLQTLSQISKVYTQSEQYIQMYRDLGVEQVESMPNLKLSSISPASPKRLESLRKELQIKENEIVIVAGSTHPGEEEIILEAYKKLKKAISQPLKLIIAPRHLHRLSSISALCQAYDISFSARSELDPSSEIIILDTMGELGAIYGLGEIVLLGGTWASIGGHNPVEPAVYGLPIIIGAHHHKVINMTAILGPQVKKARDTQEIVQTIQRLLAEQGQRYTPPDFQGLSLELVRKILQGSP